MDLGLRSFWFPSLSSSSSRSANAVFSTNKTGQEWWRRTLPSNNCITNPDLGTLRFRLAVTVNLLLIESPIGKLVSRQHHIDSGHRMLQLEVIGLCGQDLSLVTINQT